MTDKENFSGVLEYFPEQIRDAAPLGRNITCADFKNIIMCGIGGSGLPGELVKSIVKDVPITLVKDYTLPSFANSSSLVFVVSFSGNTEETLLLYEQAKKRKLQVVAVASGGKLLEKAEHDGTAYIKVPVPKTTGPSGFQPRMAFGLQTIPILNVLGNCGVAEHADWEQVAAFIGDKKKEIKEKASELAKKIGKKIPLIYASSAFYAAALKWKINFNENSKMHAFSNFFPEFNHHEINAFARRNGEYIVFILRDKEDHPRIKKRMDVFEQLVRDIELVSIESEGGDFVSRLFWMIYLGDWVSYYAAINGGVDPTPIEIVESFKKRLDEG